MERGKKGEEEEMWDVKKEEEEGKELEEKIGGKSN